jgi:hypothetical protein
VASAAVEPTLRYHPWCSGFLTLRRYPGSGHCQVGSLTGAVASQNVTEARKGSLSTVGNRAQSVKAVRELNCETDTSSRCESRP